MLNYPVESDVLLFLKHTVASLQPFAKAHSVALSFESAQESLRLTYHPETVASDLMQLLCRIITFTPQHQRVKLAVTLVNERDKFYLKLFFTNTGVNISRIGEITKGTRNTVIVHADNPKSTGYEIHWVLEKPIEMPPSVSKPVLHPPDDVRGFYAAVRDRMQSHFRKKENSMAILAVEKPEEAIFLQKIQALINANMGDEAFDVAELARSMAISRMQLHRKLKPIAHQSPAHYIRDVRLAKAKKMIEEEDLNIGEICFHVGFQSQSHFTRAFIEKYGVRPTAYRKGK